MVTMNDANLSVSTPCHCLSRIGHRSTLANPTQNDQEPMSGGDAVLASLLAFDRLTWSDQPFTDLGLSSFDAASTPPSADTLRLSAVLSLSKVRA